MLKRDGLIDTVPHRGARVVRSPHEVVDTCLIRGHLEALATKTAVPAIDELGIARLERHLEFMERSLRQATAARHGELTREFHQLIFEWSPYPRLREMIRNLWDGSASLRAVFRLAPKRLAECHRKHHELLERIKARDAEGTAALQHKLAVGVALVSAVEEAATIGDGGREASA